MLEAATSFRWLTSGKQPSSPYNLGDDYTLGGFDTAEIPEEVFVALGARFISNFELCTAHFVGKRSILIVRHIVGIMSV